MALGVPDRLVVRQDATEGIALSVNGEVLIYLKASFHCAWDRSNEYLTVEKTRDLRLCGESIWTADHSIRI